MATYTATSTFATAVVSATLATTVLSTEATARASSQATFSQLISAMGCACLAMLIVSLCLPRKPAPVPLDESEYAALVPPPAPSAPQGTLYLDLLKRVLLNIVYHEQSYQISLTRSKASGRPQPQLASAERFLLKARILGEDVALNTMSMIGLARLDSLHRCIEQLIADDVPGDLIETGVAKGGATILMRAVLRMKKDKTRRVLCCDTFCDDKPPPRPAVALLFQPLWILVVMLTYLPLGRSWHRKLYAVLMKLQRSFPVDMRHVSQDTVDSFIFYVRHGHRFLRPSVPPCGSGLAQVRSHFARLGLLDDQVVFLKGFFSETLPNAPVDRLSLIRLDGDMYASTMDGLAHLYPKLSPGGFCIVDDYYSFEECRLAVDEYRAAHGIDAEMVRIDNHAVFWREPM